MSLAVFLTWKKLLAEVFSPSGEVDWRHHEDPDPALPVQVVVSTGPGTPIRP